jgi:hypothetical protein
LANGEWTARLPVGSVRRVDSVQRSDRLGRQDRPRISRRTGAASASACPGRIPVMKREDCPATPRQRTKARIIPPSGHRHRRVSRCEDSLCGNLKPASQPRSPQGTNWPAREPRRKKRKRVRCLR